MIKDRDAVYFSTLAGFITELERRPLVTEVRIDGYIHRTGAQWCNIVVATALDERGEFRDGSWVLTRQTVFVCQERHARLDEAEDMKNEVEAALPGIEILPGIHDHPHIGNPPVWDIE